MWHKPYVVLVHEANGKRLERREYILKSHADRRIARFKKIYPDKTISMWYVSPGGGYSAITWLPGGGEYDARESNGVVDKFTRWLQRKYP